MRLLKYCSLAFLLIGASLCLYNVFSHEGSPVGSWGIVVIVIGVAMTSIFLIARSRTMS